MTKKDPNSITALKKKAWDWFSKYIRLRDCLITTGTKERGRCITCEREKPFNELQAGHFIDSRSKNVLFVEEIVHAQCKQCNLFKNGNKTVYRPKMVEIYGERKVEEFEQLINLPTAPWDKEDLKEIARYYEEEYKTAYENN